MQDIPEVDDELKKFLEEYYSESGITESPVIEIPNLNSKKKQFAQQLIMARYAKRMTQIDLAKKCGVTQPNVVRWESGKGNPTLLTLLRVCTILQIQINLK